MPVKSKLTKRKAKISKKDLAAGRRPSVLTSGWPKDEVEKLSKEEKFLNQLQDLVDSGIEIEEDDIPDDMLDVWEEFKEDIKPKITKKNWLLWSALFVPLILPGYVKGLSVWLDYVRFFESYYNLEI
jgi:Asp-tRNA(Asn)/Glu-tRNA(Gln) amidotransferase A subunit family amidase